LIFEENNYKSTTTMEEIRIKREAYLKRLNELEQEASSASSVEEQKRIAGKIRYVENKLYRLNLPPERRDYKVKIRLVFEGEVNVYSLSKKEALEAVRNSFGAVLGNVQSTTPEIINWDLPIHPEKIVR
jgi:hypothetical protein